MITSLHLVQVMLSDRIILQLSLTYAYDGRFELLAGHHIFERIDCTCHLGRLGLFGTSLHATKE